MSEVPENALQRAVAQPEKRCKEPGCLSPYISRGLCVKHYSRVIYAERKADPERAARRRLEREHRQEAARKKEQRRLASARRRAADPAKEAAYQRQYQTKNLGTLSLARRLNTYGMKVPEFRQMLEVQNRTCALCPRSVVPRTCHVDHCHTTGRVRGLLCNGCNIGLGHYERFQRLDALAKVVAYLATPA